MKTSADPADLVWRLGSSTQAGGGPSRAWLVVLVVGLVVSMVPVTGLGQTGGDAVDELAGPPWRAWTTETVRSQADLMDPDGWEREDLSGADALVAIDDEDEVHLAFPRNPPGELVDIIYAWQEDGEWRFDMVEPSALPEDLAVDGEGRPWVSWLEDGITYVATRNSTDSAWWRIDVPENGPEPQIEIGPQGKVHVLFRPIVDGIDPIRHGTFDPQAPEEGWSFSTADHGILSWMDLAIDADGHAHAVWTPGTGPSRYAVQTGQGWQAMDVPGCDRDNAVDVAPDGTVHVACKARGTPAGVVHATREPGSEAWSVDIASDGSQLTPPRTALDIGYSTDIVVDEEGVPHIAYATRANIANPDDPLNPKRPVYAVKTGATCPTPLEEGIGTVPGLRWTPQDPCADWHVQAVDHEGLQTGTDTSLALDGDGVPSLAYTFRSRVASEGCHQVTNPCYDVRLARPVASALSQAGS